MSILIEKLHAAARRYCIDKHHYWTKRYDEIVKAGRDRDDNTYTNDALDVFPRYNVLNAILVEIERFTPQDFLTLEEAKELISASGYLAEDMFTKAPTSPIAKKSMEEERAAFVHFIRTLSEEELDKVEPLPYRRVIQTSEKQQIRAGLKKVWDIPDSYWYPLSESNPGDVVAFQDKYLQEEIGAETLRTLLMNHGITRVWELREYGPEYEMELADFNPYYNGAEGYWCSQDMDWIIYASHESSITIGGWLLDEVERVWPNWKERIWTTSSFG